MKRYEVDWDNPPVLTEGHGLYVRIARGAYAKVDRRGRRIGGIHSGFQPRPRWRPARRCSYEIPHDGLTCPRCGRYDTGYAETGVRSYCGNQGAADRVEARSLRQRCADQEKALEALERRLVALTDYVREAAGEESVLVPVTTLSELVPKRQLAQAVMNVMQLDLLRRSEEERAVLKQKLRGV